MLLPSCYQPEVHAITSDKVECWKALRNWMTLLTTASEGHPTSDYCLWTLPEQAQDEVFCDLQIKNSIQHKRLSVSRTESKFQIQP